MTCGTLITISQLYTSEQVSKAADFQTGRAFNTGTGSGRILLTLTHGLHASVLIKLPRSVKLSQLRRMGRPRLKNFRVGGTRRAQTEVWKLENVVGSAADERMRRRAEQIQKTKLMS